MSKRSRACDSCRARKAACRIDGEPLCYLCTLHRKECTFLHPTNRSRRNPDRVLGKQRQLMINPAPAELQDSALLFDDLTSFGALASTRSSAMDPSSPREPGSVLGLINQNFSSLVDGFNHEPWPAGFSPGSFLCASPGAPRSLPSVEMAPENRKDSSAIELDDDAAETPVLLGSSGDMDPFLLRDYQYDASGNFHFKNLDIQSMATRVRPTQFLLAQPSIFATAREETGSDGYSAHSQRENLEVIVPEDIGHRLIDLFQRIIIPQYPIFSSSSRLDPRTSPPYLLASIYMLAESFIKFDERLCIDLAYEKPSAKALYQIINDAVSHAIHAPTLSIAETLFLLIIRPYPNPIVQDTSFKWTQLSTLVACAHSLGLHLDPRLWQIPPSQIAQRRRLSYFIYSVDKWLALGLGRPPMVNSETWSVTHLDAGDHLDSGISSLAWSADMKRSELDSLLDRVLKQL